MCKTKYSKVTKKNCSDIITYFDLCPAAKVCPVGDDNVRDGKHGLSYSLKSWWLWGAWYVCGGSYCEGKKYTCLHARDYISPQIGKFFWQIAIVPVQTCRNLLKWTDTRKLWS